MISNKKTCFQILDRLHIGDEFTGYNLMGAVELQTGKMLYPSSALRYLREFRDLTGRQIVNIHKTKSLYKCMS